MTSQEHSLVRAFKDYFRENQVDAVMFRDSQHIGSDQKLDIFLDSAEYGFYGIEHKAVKLSSTNKLYFSQHFSEKEMEDGEVEHQIETISQFLNRSGRKGYLAIQVRRGRGKPTDTYILDWEFVKELYEDESEAGIDLRLLDEWAEDENNVVKVARENSQWVVDDKVISFLT